MRRISTKLLLAFLLLCGASTYAQNVRGFYLQDVGTWLGNSAEENKILSYAQGNGFNYILFYDLGQITWTNATSKNNLAAFIRKAKAQYGIIQVGGVVEYSGYVTQNILPYNNARTSALEKFDVINMEFEFWVRSSISSSYCSKFLSPNGFSCDTAGAWKFAWREFKIIDDLCSRNGMISEWYIGWPNLGQLQQIASRADRILISAYRPSDSDIYVYSKNRFKDIATIGGTTKVLTLLSAESSFMGPWLNSHPQTQPYQTLRTALNAETMSFKNNIDLQGYQWFTYKYMPKTIIATASITTSGATTICSGSSVTLTANSGTAYLWSPGGATTRSINASLSGSYTVRVTNSSGVSVTSSPTVVTVSNSGGTPVISTSGPTTFCQGGNVVLTSTTASTYQWSNGETTQSITITNPGSYTVTTGGTCGGTSTPVVVSTSSGQTPVITASGPTTFCPGGSVDLTSSSAPSYLWSSGETTQTITVSNTDDYTVTTGGACGGTSSAVSVSNNGSGPAPVITVSGPTTFCPGGSVDLTASLAPSYIWSDGETTQTITVSTTGTYFVTTGGNCGGTSAAVDISANGSGASPVITASGPTSFCPGGSVVLTSTAGQSYLWSSGETTQSITVTTSGSYSVTTGGTCGGVSAPIVISATSSPNAPVISASGSLSVCPGSILTLTSSQANGYVWSNGATTRTISVNAAGDYTVTTVNSANCSATSAVSRVSLLTAPSKPVITPNSSTTLTSSHTSVILTSSVANAYKWSTNSTSRAITVTSQGSFRVTVTGSNGCTNYSDDVLVTANGCTPPPTPIITTSGPTTISAGQNVTLTSSLAGGYLWSNGAQTRSISVTTAGVYTVRNYNKGSCFSTSLPVTVTLVLARMANPNEAIVEKVEFNIFPNPATENITVDFNSAVEKRVSIKLLDITGKEVYSRELNAIIGENQVQVDISGMPRGIYLAYLSGENLNEFKKVIVE
jgi:hypothetical protein